MSFDAKTRQLVAFLTSQAEASAELAPMYTQMEDLYSRKLWHQLTLLLEDFAALESTASMLVPLYDSFIVDFKHRMNKLALARLQVNVAQQYGDIQKVAFFLKGAAEEARKDDREASSYILCELARMLLEANQIVECKEQLDQAAEFLEGSSGIDNRVQASYYRAQSAYYKVKGPAADFYKKSLLLLAYSPLSQMRKEEAITISFDLGIAALVGEGLYNFGELLEHPVVTVLEETQFAWLAHFIRAFNAGNIAEYEALVATYHTQLEEQPALVPNSIFLKEKITLMCLTETLFQRIGPSGDRTIAFAHISEASKLPIEQVEILIMRALSLGLVRGIIDQVDQTLRVTWVQPRVLQTPQISLMQKRLQTWCGTVDKTLVFLENETPEFAS